MKKQESLFPGIAVGVGLVIAALVIFFAGVWVGERRIWRHPMVRRAPWSMHRLGPPPFRHGIVGTVAAIEENTLRVSDRRDGEKTVLVDEKTQIRKNEATVAISDLAIGDAVTIIGEPVKEKTNTVTARLIRVGPKWDKHARL